MSDPKAVRGGLWAAPNPLFLRDEELTRGFELLELAYRVLETDIDRHLGRGLGRNHQRVLYFVGQHPGVTLVGLIRLLRLTKQSLSRLLKELVAAGLISQETNPQDRRQRLLRLTPAGARLEEQITRCLRGRLAAAYRAAGAEAVAGYHQVLAGLVDEAGRRGWRDPQGRDRPGGELHRRDSPGRDPQERDLQARGSRGRDPQGRDA